MIITSKSLYDGSNYVAERLVDKFKGAYDAALVDDGILTIWTPTTGSRFNLRGLVIAVSTSTAYFEIYDSATLIYSFRSGNNYSNLYLPPNGYPSLVVNNALTLKNVNSGTYGFYVFAWGFESV